MPRSAITSIGRQPSKYGVSFSQSLKGVFSPSRNAVTKASYWALSSGQLM